MSYKFNSIIVRFFEMLWFFIYIKKLYLKIFFGYEYLLMDWFFLSSANLIYILYLDTFDRKEILLKSNVIKYFNYILKKEVLISLYLIQIIILDFNFNDSNLFLIKEVIVIIVFILTLIGVFKNIFNLLINL